MGKMMPVPGCTRSIGWMNEQTNESARTNCKINLSSDKLLFYPTNWTLYRPVQTSFFPPDCWYCTLWIDLPFTFKQNKGCNISRTSEHQSNEFENQSKPIVRGSSLNGSVTKSVCLDLYDIYENKSQKKQMVNLTFFVFVIIQRDKKQKTNGRLCPLVNCVCSNENGQW